nr:MAG TPA: hypothetical protein [Caudoviricetes sp.]
MRTLFICSLDTWIGDGGGETPPPCVSKFSV